MMSKHMRNFLLSVIVFSLTCPVFGQRGSRVAGYGYRESADFVVKRLGLKNGSVVVDIGAGDGFWSRKMAEKVGANGVIHAGEIDQNKVDSLKSRLGDVPQIKPYLCPTDGTGLEENSCDLAFLSKTYHHLNKDSHVEYLKHLKKVVKPSGRVCVIERHPDFATGGGKNHAWMPGLLARQGEEAGWMLLRYEMIKNSDHFMVIFADPEFQVKKFSQKQEQSRKQTAESEN